MKYTITWCEKKHIDSLNKDVLDCNATDEQGDTAKFSIWSDFPNFAGIMNGGVVEGNIWNKPNTDKYTLYPPKDPATANVGRVGAITKAQEKKAEYIEKAQDNRERGIKLSSTIRMATDVVIAILKDEKIIDESTIKSKITEWRKWFVEHWDDADVPF